MKDENEIEEIIVELGSSPILENLHGMTYKQGIEDALAWVLEEITTNELLND